MTISKRTNKGRTRRVLANATPLSVRPGGKISALDKTQTVGQSNEAVLVHSAKATRKGRGNVQHANEKVENQAKRTQ